MRVCETADFTRGAVAGCRWSGALFLMAVAMALGASAAEIRTVDDAHYYKLRRQSIEAEELYKRITSKSDWLADYREKAAAQEAQKNQANNQALRESVAWELARRREKAAAEEAARHQREFDESMKEVRAIGKRFDLSLRAQAGEKGPALHYIRCRLEGIDPNTGQKAAQDLSSAVAIAGRIQGLGHWGKAWAAIPMWETNRIVGSSTAARELMAIDAPTDPAAMNLALISLVDAFFPLERVGNSKQAAISDLILRVLAALDHWEKVIPPPGLSPATAASIRFAQKNFAAFVLPESVDAVIDRVLARRNVQPLDETWASLAPERPKRQSASTVEPMPLATESLVDFAILASEHPKVARLVVKSARVAAPPWREEPATTMFFRGYIAALCDAVPPTQLGYEGLRRDRERLERMLPERLPADLPGIRLCAPFLTKPDLMVTALLALSRPRLLAELSGSAHEPDRELADSLLRRFNQFGAIDEATVIDVAGSCGLGLELHQVAADFAGRWSDARGVKETDAPSRAWSRALTSLAAMKTPTKAFELIEAIEFAGAHASGRDASALGKVKLPFGDAEIVGRSLEYLRRLPPYEYRWADLRDITAKLSASRGTPEFERLITVELEPLVREADDLHAYDHGPVELLAREAVASKAAAQALLRSVRRAPAWAEGAGTETERRNNPLTARWQARRDAEKLTALLLVRNHTTGPLERMPIERSLNETALAGGPGAPEPRWELLGRDAAFGGIATRWLLAQGEKNPVVLAGAEGPGRMSLPLKPELLVEELASRLRAGDEQARRHAAEALGRLADYGSPARAAALAVLADNAADLPAPASWSAGKLSFQPGFLLARIGWEVRPQRRGDTLASRGAPVVRLLGEPAMAANLADFVAEHLRTALRGEPRLFYIEDDMDFAWSIMQAAAGRLPGGSARLDAFLAANISSAALAGR